MTIDSCLLDYEFLFQLSNHISERKSTVSGEHHTRDPGRGRSFRKRHPDAFLSSHSVISCGCTRCAGSAHYLPLGLCRWPERLGKWRFRQALQACLREFSWFADFRRTSPCPNICKNTMFSRSTPGDLHGELVGGVLVRGFSQVLALGFCGGLSMHLKSDGHGALI